MTEEKKIFIIIPAYNEANALTKLIPQIQSVCNFEILIINDGSHDNTSNVATRNGAIVIEHAINRGAGAATKTGFEYAISQNVNYIITMDADGQHSPSDISNVIKPLLNGKYDVSIGSRLLNRENMPFIRKVFNKIGNLVTLVLTGLYVQDSQSGFKAFSRHALTQIHLEYDGYEFCSQMISEIKRNNLKFIEVPIQTIYTDYSLSKGQSFSKGISTVIKLLIGK